jgi:hypothetical protein
MVSLDLEFANSQEARIISFAFSSFASLVSFYNVYRHLRNYTHPSLQMYMVRIIVIVPVYAIASCLSLRFQGYSLWFEVVRDVYESFVVYSFLCLVLKYVGGDSACIANIQFEPPLPHVWPMNYCFKPMPRNHHFLRYCKQGCIQFVIIKPLSAMCSLFMLGFDAYENVYYQIVLITVYNISYTIALYVLLLFYLATKKLLRPFNAVSKVYFYPSSLLPFSLFSLNTCYLLLYNPPAPPPTILLPSFLR